MAAEVIEAPRRSTTGMRPSIDGRRWVPAFKGTHAGAAGGVGVAGADELPPPNSTRPAAASAPTKATATARTQTEAERKTSRRETL